MPDERPPEDRLDFASLERLSPTAPPPKEKKGSGLTKAIAFLVPLIILAAVPWVLLTKFFKTTPVKPRPTISASASPSASASASPSPLAARGTYEVVNLHGTACLRVHESPGTGSPLVGARCLQLGIRVTSDGRTAEAENLPWLHIRYQNADGWAAATYLKKVT